MEMRRILPLAASVVFLLPGCGFLVPDVGGEGQSCAESTEACQAGLVCNQGICCRSQVAKACHEGKVYWLDSCGQWESLAEDCPACKPCRQEGDRTPVCTLLEAHAYKRCLDGDIHWIDSCDEDAGVAEACSGNTWCEDLGQRDAHCRCLGNFDPDTDCEECKNHWTDEGDDCGTCPGNWDPESDCAVCRNHWIDEVNDCETCPGNWSEIGRAHV